MIDCGVFNVEGHISTYACASMLLYSLLQAYMYTYIYIYTHVYSFVSLYKCIYTYKNCSVCRVGRKVTILATALIFGHLGAPLSPLSSFFDVADFMKYRQSLGLGVLDRMLLN